MLIKKTGLRPSQNMGTVFISERSNMDNREITSLDVHDKHGIFYVSFDANLHSFGVMNRNNRMYLADNVWECITKSEKIQRWLADNAWFGEMNHPLPKYKDRPLSPERIQDIDMDNTSHKMLNPHVEGNLLISRIQTDAGTDAGMNLARKMIQGFIPAFSCRAIATLVMKGGKPVVVVRKIITYDWVLFQSHREAEQTSKPAKFVSKVANTVNEVTEKVTDAVNNNIVIPLKEILENVGRTDVNAQIIMESFELDTNDLVGFTKDNKHMIMRDNNNMIYCDIDAKSRSKVNDFFRSFN